MLVQMLRRATVRLHPRTPDNYNPNSLNTLLTLPQWGQHGESKTIETRGNGGSCGGLLLLHCGKEQINTHPPH